MNWRLKCLAFKLIEAMSGGDLVYRAAQRLVTGRYLPKVKKSLGTYMIPVEAFKGVEGAKSALEFGAGRGLISPLLLSAAGAERVHAFDLQRIAHIEQVNAVIAQLDGMVQGNWRSVRNFRELDQQYGINYQAPADARATGLADGSVDLVYSTATLEHIPHREIRAILRECRRILQPNGRICFTIDYHDHYASADPNIGFMNFYQFGEDEWRRFNPDMHYQNRLRHSDYITLFEEEAWRIVEQWPAFERWSESDLARVKLHPSFEHYSHEDLTASNGFFLLRP